MGLRFIIEVYFALWTERPLKGSLASFRPTGSVIIKRVTYDHAPEEAVFSKKKKKKEREMDQL